jgi:hypothetical protein
MAANRRPAWQVVMLGVLADFAGTLAGSLVLTFVAALSLGAPGQGDEVAAVRELLESGLWNTIGFGVGSLATVLGGYVAARAAGRDHYAFAAVTGLAVLLIGEMLSPGGEAGASLLMRVLGWVITIPLALVGAHLRVRQTEPRPPEARS